MMKENEKKKNGEKTQLKCIENISKVKGIIIK